MTRPRRQPPRGQPAFAETPLARWLVMLLLVLGVVVAYHNTLGVPFLLDDADSIANNPSIRSLATAWRPPTDSGFTVSGRPLLNLSLAVNYAIHGTSVAGYHVGNILIHALATLSLFALVRHTLRLPGLADRFGRHALPLAACGAALWALHPMQTAAVTYIIQRAELLAGLCFLLTLYAFARAAERESRAWMVACCVACYLGMLSKEVMAAAPLVVALYDRTFLSGSWREAWRRHRGIHLALAAGWLLLAALVFTSGARGSTVGFGTVPWAGYVLTQLAGIGRYLGHVAYPPGLVFDYGATVEDRVLPIVVGAGVVIAWIVATVVLMRRAPAAGFLGAWFLLILAPTSSVIPVMTQTLAEHRMYLPLAAVALAVCVAVYRLGPRWAWGVLPVLVVGCAAGTIGRNRAYASAITIWEDTVAKAPYNTRAWTSLGVAYLEAGRVDEAIRSVSQAVDLAPESAGVQADMALTLVRANRPLEATTHYETATRLAPDFAEAHIGYGVLLRKLGRLDDSVIQLRRAVELAPDSARARSNLGISLLVLRRVDEAIPELAEAVRIDPTMVQTHYFLGDALADAGRFEEAIGQLEAVVALSADSSSELLNYLGVLYAQTGQLTEAIDRFRRALAVDPNHASARENLTKIEARLSGKGP